MDTKSLRPGGMITAGYKTLLLCCCLAVCIGGFAQKQIPADELYYTRLKTAEAYLRLNQVGEATKILNAVEPGQRGFEWQLLNARANRSVHTFTAHTKPVVGIAVSKNGRCLASGSADNSIIIWDAVTYKTIRKIEGHKGQVTTLDFSPDGSTLVSGSTDKTLRLWKVDDGTEIRNYNNEFKQGIYQVRFSHDGTQLAAASWELVTVNGSRSVQGFAKVLDVQTGRLVQRFDTDDHPAAAVAFSADDKKLYTGTWGFFVKQHDITGGTTNWSFDMSGYDYYTAVQSIDVAHNGQHLVQGGKDGKIRLLNAADGKLIRQIENWEGHTEWVNGVRFSPDGKLFASASDDGRLKVWETATAKPLFTFKGHTGGLNQLAWHPDGKRIFTTSADNTIKIWRLDEPGELSFKPGSVGPWFAPISPNGTLLAPAAYDKVFALWNLQTGQRHLMLDSFNATTAAFTADGKYVAAGHYTINMYEVATGRKMSTGKGHSGRILGMDYSAVHQLFATAGDRTVRLWKTGDTAAYKTIATAGAANATVFSPDGKYLYAGCGDGKLRMITTAGWQLVDSVAMQTNPINNMAIAAGGRFVATIGEAGEAKVYDTKTKQLTELKGHIKPGFAIAFHPWLPIVVTGSYDRTLRFWNAETGANTLTLFGFADVIYTVSFSKDGKRIVITEVEGKAHVINL